MSEIGAEMECFRSYPFTPLFGGRLFETISGLSVFGVFGGLVEIGVIAVATAGLYFGGILDRF